MMTPQQALLWQQILDFELDDPAADFKFSDRLARENGWKRDYSHRVIQEYKKFIFMCCVSADGVTPSDAVDQAWHLHLTFTRSYWINLCENTLGRQIHHNPTKGGQAEASRFDSYYTGSGKLYRDLFNMAPPADIWPNNHTRFTDINFRRVNVSRYWLLPKPHNMVQVSVLLMLMASVPLFVQASETVMALGIMVSVIAIVIFAVYKSGGINDKKNGADGNDGCSDDGGDSHHGGHHGHGGDNGGGHGGGDSGCSSGCSGCSSSGCSGCGGGGH
jgi:hypothetical protein